MKTPTAVSQQLQIFEKRGNPLMNIQSIKRGAYFLIEAGLIKKEASVLFVLDVTTKKDVADFKYFEACLFDPNTNKWSGVKSCEVKREFGKLLFSELTWSVFTMTGDQQRCMNNQKPQAYWTRMFVAAQTTLEGIRHDTSPKTKESMAASLAEMVVTLHANYSDVCEKLADVASFYHVAVDALMDHWKTMKNPEEAKIIKQLIVEMGRAEGAGRVLAAQRQADYEEAMDK